MPTTSEISRSRSAFDSYNIHRIYTAICNFSDPENDIFSVVPLLLHYNYAIEGLSCPKTTPHGMYAFSPGKSARESFKRLFPGDGLLNAKPDTPSILCLALIGSLGTAAQTKKSDFDYMLFLHPDGFTGRKLKNLREKLSSVEQWADSQMNIEVHFYIEDIRKFKENRFGITDKEHVGSAESNLFKDEFYRTAVFVAGKRPLWWITPPGMSESGAKEFVAACPSLTAGDGEYIDMGQVITADPQEFFGGALWHINKLMTSPFKSLLKLALHESYLFDSGSGLLCEELKREVLESGGKHQEIDPYVKMCERVVTYYSGCGLLKEVRLLQGSFLLKTGFDPDKIEELIDCPEDNLDEKQRTVKRLLCEWGWTGEDIAVLRRDLIPQVKNEGSSDAVNRFFLDVYIRLSDWLKKSGVTGKMISEEDMTMLGRRLFGYLEKKPGKIPLIPPGSRPHDYPPRISLIDEKTGPGKRRWSLYDFHITGMETAVLQNISKPLIRSLLLGEVLVWMVINGFWQPRTRLFFEGAAPYTERGIQHILVSLFDFFISQNPYEPLREDYLFPVRTLKAFIIPNFGLKKSPGRIERVEMALLNSWGEYTLRRMRPQNAYLETAEMFPFAETAREPFFIKVISPLSQNDPGLTREFEYSVDKIKRRLRGKKRDGRDKVRLDVY